MKRSVENFDETIFTYNFEVEDWHTYFVSDSDVLVHNMCTMQFKGFIKHDIYNKIRNELGDAAVKKFVEAMNKGIVSAQGQNGVKLLSGRGIQISNNWYKYEVKVLGQYGDYRLFGNLDGSGQVMFTLFGRHKS